MNYSLYFNQKIKLEFLFSMNSILLQYTEKIQKLCTRPSIVVILIPRIFTFS